MEHPLYACLHVPNGASDLETLVAIAELYSPRYARHGKDAVVVDISGLTRLLGPPSVIAREIARSARERGLTIQLAIARTRMAALVLARARPGVTVVPPGEQTAALAQVKLSQLSPAPALQTFTRWGVRTLGELAALPADQLAARMGADGARWQAMARGEDLEPLVPDRADERFEATHELEWPIDGLEPLSFVLTRLFEPLSARLEARDRGVAVLHVTLHLVTREVHARRLELPAPLREAKTLRTLALLDLESHPPAAAIDRVTVCIEPTPGRVLQHTLFSRAQPAPDQVATLVARLGALMGQDRVGSPVVVDTWRPGAFAMRPWRDQFTIHNLQVTNSSRPLITALRRVRQPVPARVVVDQGRPVRVTTDRVEVPGGRVLSCTGPWRSSGNWWASATPRGRESTLEAEGRNRSVTGVGVGPHASKKSRSPASSKNSWHRDEWDVVLSDGAAYRVFEDRDRQRWFLEAVFD